MDGIVHRIELSFFSRSQALGEVLSSYTTIRSGAWEKPSVHARPKRALPSCLSAQFLNNNRTSLLYSIRSVFVASNTDTDRFVHVEANGQTNSPRIFSLETNQPWDSIFFIDYTMGTYRGMPTHWNSFPEDISRELLPMGDKPSHGLNRCYGIAQHILRQQQWPVNIGIEPYVKRYP